MIAKILNFIGSRVLPYKNRRVVCPPGLPSNHKRPNIIVATPMRSGTHILIDILLNNIPSLRVSPLYIDIDHCMRLLEHRDVFFNKIESNTGQVIKTHYPIGVAPSLPKHKELLALIDSGIVITINRSESDILKSISSWDDLSEFNGIDEMRTQLPGFWLFWESRANFELKFEDLFDSNKMMQLVAEVGLLVNTSAAKHYRGPTSMNRKSLIYINKALTRMLGKFSPKIDTTIHTLK